MSSDKIYPKGSGTFESTGNSGKVMIGQDDLTNHAKDTIGSYLNQKTRGVSEPGRPEFQGPESANKYPISEDRTPMSVIDDGTGKPYGPTVAADGDGHLEALKSLEKDALIAFNNLSKGYMDNDQSSSSAGLRMGGTFLPDEQPEKRGQEDGHTFLSGKDHVSAVFAANRFTKMTHYNENPYLETMGSGASTETQFRDFAPIDSLGVRGDARQFIQANEVDKLAKIGSALLLAAAGDIKAGGNVGSAEKSSGDNAGPGGSSIGALFTFDANTGIVDPGAAKGSVPGGMQRVPVTNFDAGSYSGNGQSANTDGIYNKGSFGTMNSYMDPFQAMPGREHTMYELAILQMLALLVGLISTMLIIEAFLMISTGIGLLKQIGGDMSPLDVIFAEPGLIKGSDLQKGRGRARTRAWDFEWFGAHKLLEGGVETIINITDVTLEYLDIAKPMHVMNFWGNKSPLLALALPYTQAVFWGWSQMFMGHLVDFGASSGFWNAVTRGIMRSEGIKGDFLKMGPKSSGKLSALFAFMKRLREAKLTGLVRTLAEIGDISVSSGFYGMYTFANRDYAKPASMMPNSPKYIHYKMRDNTGQSSVRTGAAPSMMMLSLNTIAGGLMMRTLGHDIRIHDLSMDSNMSNDVIAKLAADNGKISDAPFAAKLTMAGHPPVPSAWGTEISEEGPPSAGAGTTPLSPTRFSRDQVKLLEDALQAEYVPFYFHDLRTNEIIAFHAFLNSLSDGYSADYNKQQGFGRIEPAMIYGGASRSISFDFTVWAMSPNDYDEMWWKINKLTTLMYPQWSAGKLVVQGPAGKATEQFTVPFSQVPTASPLCRIRVGDLFSSNYSKFSLARLHGVDSGKFTWAGKYGAKEFALTPIGIPKVEKDLLTQASEYWEKRKKIIADYAEGKKDFSKMPGFTVFTIAPGFRYKCICKDGIKTIVFQQPIDVLTIAPLPGTEGGGSDAPAASADMKDSTIACMPWGPKVQEILQKELPASRIPTIIYVKPFNIQGLKVGRTIDAIGELLMGYEELPSLGDSPFSSKGNPIVRAFESTAGRGLAGVIESMDFDWDIQSIPWDTHSGQGKGPMGCKISVSFQPIHDITPGIDAYGMNRAPIYGIGKTTNLLRGDPHETGNVEFEKASKTIGEAAAKHKADMDKAKPAKAE